MNWRARSDHLALGLLCLTLLWGPLAQGSTAGWGLSGLTVLGCLTLVLTLLALSVRSQLRPNLWWISAALAFLAWVWLSVTWAPYQADALRWAGVWTAVVGTAISGHVLATTRRRQGLVLGAVILTGSASLAMALLQTQGVILAGFAAYPGVGPGLVSGPYFNPSHFSGFLIPVAALLTSLLLFTRVHLHTLALIGLLGALHVLNLKTDSSSIPAVMLATGTPFLVWVWTKQRVVGSVLTALTLGGALWAGAFFLNPAGQAWFASHQQQLGVHRDWGSFMQQRQATWRYAVELWQERPWQGTGIGQFPTESPRHRASVRDAAQAINRQNVNYAHSDRLQLLSELGWPGLVTAGLILLLALGRACGQLSRRVWWATLPALLFVGLYDAHATAIPGTAVTLFVLSGLAAAQLRDRAGAESVAQYTVETTLPPADTSPVP